MRRSSLTRRIILSATLVLAVFITLTALALERAFVSSATSALQDQLTSQLYALMAAAEVDSSGVVQMPSDELDALLGLPSSGRYAAITTTGDELLWRSASVLGTQPPSPITLAAGDKRFVRTTLEERRYFSLAYGVRWIAGDGDEQAIPLTFNIATDLSSFDRQIERYRKTLLGWLLGMALLLVVSQALILRWGLAPLRRVGDEINTIEAGNQDAITGDYPEEIERLSDNINLLLRHERERQSRYRNALGDLAHSLKTPLAVLKAALDPHAAGTEQQRQLDRMGDIIEYQLQRAATAGSSSIGSRIALAPVVERLADSLRKVYRDKDIDLRSEIPGALAFRGDEGDLMELLGNLLDNACKWTRQRVDIRAERVGDWLVIEVSDDGPGIEPALADSVLRRGGRADQSISGHGIGLSIVSDIVAAYGGDIDIGRSAAGGAHIRLRLPVTRSA